MATFDGTVKQLVGEIRKRRENLEKTQEDVAFESGLSVRHYQQIESGAETNPRLKTIYNIATSLETTVAVLLEPKPAKKRSASTKRKA